MNQKEWEEFQSNLQNYITLHRSLEKCTPICMKNDDEVYLDWRFLMSIIFYPEVKIKLRPSNNDTYPVECTGTINQVKIYSWANPSEVERTFGKRE